MLVLFSQIKIHQTYSITWLLSKEESKASVPRLCSGVLLVVSDHTQGKGDHGGGHSSKVSIRSSSQRTGACSHVTAAKRLPTKSRDLKIEKRHFFLSNLSYLSFDCEAELEARVPCGIVT